MESGFGPDAKGDKRRSLSEQSQGSSSSPQSPNRRSELLDHVRRTQLEALENRTQERVKELLQGATMSPQVGSARESMRTRSAVKLSPSESMKQDSGSVNVPNTAIRRNVTQRRSRGRAKDEGDQAPSLGLLDRRPRSRSKDRRYSVESQGELADCERQDWRSAGARFQPSGAPKTTYQVVPYSMYDPDQGLRINLDRATPRLEKGAEKVWEDREETRDLRDTSNVRSHLAYRVPSSTGVSEGVARPYGFQPPRNPTTPFRKEFIPHKQDNPEIHEFLLNKWYERQEAVRGLGDALAEDDLDRYDMLQKIIDDLNAVMHEKLQGDNETRVQQIEGTSPLNISSTSQESIHPEPKYHRVDDLPLGGHSETVFRKQSFKESADVFSIRLSFQNVVGSRFVNDNMPLRSLFAMARSFVQIEFGFQIQSEEDVELVHRDTLLSREGVLGSVPIRDGDLIVVDLPLFGMSTPHRTGIGSNQSGGGQGSGGQNSDSSMNKSTPDSPQSQSSREGFHGCTPDPQFNYQTARNQDPKEGIPKEFLTPSPNSLDPRSYDKIRQSFRCPRFSGQAKEWKQWDKGFLRYLSIWELDYVIDPSFFDYVPLTAEQRRDNKLVYYVIEDAVQNSPLAASYVRQAPINNGFEAYYTLHDGYVFAGTTTATLLLNELSNFRFLPNETPTELCMRLEEIFQELKLLPGDASVTFVDTQQIGYLLNALRHEKEWDHVCSTITSKQIQGAITFRQACDELKFRCEATRAHELMDRPVKGKKVKGLIANAKEDIDLESVTEQILGLISTAAKRRNAITDAPNPTPNPAADKNDRKKKKLECLAADCAELTAYPLCSLHYHSLVSAKISSLSLRNKYGEATFDPTTNTIAYPSKVPKDRLPVTGPKRASALAAGPQ